MFPTETVLVTLCHHSQLGSGFCTRSIDLLQEIAGRTVLSVSVSNLSSFSRFRVQPVCCTLATSTIPYSFGFERPYFQAQRLQMVSRNAILASGLVAFATAGLLFPVGLSKMQSKPIIDSRKPLSPGAIMRGPYINAGSRDVGPDPTPRKIN